MKETDIDYTLSNFVDILSCPIRVYFKKNLIKKYSTTELIIDPVELYLEKIFKQNKNVSIFSAPYFFYYGVINNLNYTIIIGPATIYLDDENIRHLSYDLGISSKDYSLFKDSIKLTSSTPFITFTKVLILINFILNKEKIKLTDIMPLHAFTKLKDDKMSLRPLKTSEHFNSLEIENKILKIVHDGNLEALDIFINNLKTINAGKLSLNPIRQERNLFIVTVTLISREAIKVGVDPEECLTLSDNYIQQSDIKNSIQDLTKLYYQCAYDFTKKVALLKNAKTILEKQVFNYILRNISKRITLDELANHLYMSKSNLCIKFKKETGISVNTFILKSKINIAKDLLLEQKKSISYISDYLGFSSPSHFSKVFKSITNIAPKDFIILNND